MANSHFRKSKNKKTPKPNKSKQVYSSPNKEEIKNTNTDLVAPPPRLLTRIGRCAVNTGNQAIATTIYCTVTPIAWSISQVLWISAAPIRVVSGVLERILPENEVDSRVEDLEERLKLLETEMQSLKRSIEGGAFPAAKQSKISPSPRALEPAPYADDIPPPPAPFDDDIPPPPPPPPNFVLPKLKPITKSTEPVTPTKSTGKEALLNKLAKTPTMGRVTLADITQVKLRKRTSPKQQPGTPSHLDVPKPTLQLRKVQKSPGGTPMRANPPIPAKTHVSTLASPIYNAIQNKFKLAYSDENIPPTPANMSINSSWS